MTDKETVRAAGLEISKEEAHQLVHPVTETTRIDEPEVDKLGKPGRYEGFGTVDSARTRRSQSSELRRPIPAPKRRKHN